VFIFRSPKASVTNFFGFFDHGGLVAGIGCDV
jgi:hypothetical protein